MPNLILQWLQFFDLPVLISWFDLKFRCLLVEIWSWSYCCYHGFYIATKFHIVNETGLESPRLQLSAQIQVSNVQIWRPRYGGNFHQRRSIYPRGSYIWYRKYRNYSHAWNCRLLSVNFVNFCNCVGVSVFFIFLHQSRQRIRTIGDFPFGAPVARWSKRTRSFLYYTLFGYLPEGRSSCGFVRYSTAGGKNCVQKLKFGTKNSKNLPKNGP